MKILAVSDQVDERLYTPTIRERFSEMDLVLGCGDLPYAYLEFIVSLLNVPLYYVPGNHDPCYEAASPDTQAEGCVFLDQRVVRAKGLLIAGLGGSIIYKPGGANQHTQAEMYWRSLRLWPALAWNRLRYGRFLDILIAHSPPRGIHDDNDAAHIGFDALRDFIQRFRPHYFLHGHTIAYKNNLVPPVTRVCATMVVNVYPYRLIEIEVQ